MPTKKMLSVSPFGDQKEINFFTTVEGNMMLETSYNEFPIYIEIKPEDWEDIKNFIEEEFKKLN